MPVRSPRWESKRCRQQRRQPGHRQCQFRRRRLRHHRSQFHQPASDQRRQRRRLRSARPSSTNTACGNRDKSALGHSRSAISRCWWTSEDLTGSGEFGISNPYHGFTWETPGHNFDWLNGTTLPARFRLSDRQHRPWPQCRLPTDSHSSRSTSNARTEAASSSRASISRLRGIPRCR